MNKIGKTNLFEHEEDIMANFDCSGVIRKKFSFKLLRKNNKDFPETYYGNMFLIKYFVIAQICVDDIHEGTAKIEIQMRNYWEEPLPRVPHSSMITPESFAVAGGQNSSDKEAPKFDLEIKLSSSNVDIEDVISGSLVFKNYNQKIKSVFAGLIRNEVIYLGSNPIEKQNCYQTIEIIKGDPGKREIEFVYHVPKNFSSAPSSKKVSFMVDFLFGIKILTEFGYVMSQTIPINFYRVRPD